MIEIKKVEEVKMKLTQSDVDTVSYTHLDVYKRQMLRQLRYGGVTYETKFKKLAK